MLTGRMFFYRGASLGASLFLALMFLTCGGVGVAQDGKAYFWEQVTGAAPWAARTAHTSVTLGNRLLVFAGFSKTTDRYMQDVWASADGEVWEELTEAAPWGARAGQAGLRFQEKVWLLGGSASSDTYNDVWNSSDGLHWERVLEAGPWEKRSMFSVVDFRGTLVLLGGFLGLNDVWTSSGGDSWSELIAEAAWSKRYGPGAVCFQDKLWVTAGLHYEQTTGTWTLLNDVWTSSDGSSWSQVVSHAPWQGRASHAVIAFDDRLWVLGGSCIEGTPPYATTRYLNDVWHSGNGRDWTHAPNAPWAARSGHAAAVFGGKLWVLGGTKILGSDTVSLNDVWRLTAAPASIQMDHAGPYQAGEALTMTVAAPGLPSGITYQWFKDGVVLSGQTSATYRLSAVAEGDAGSYSCGIGGAAFGTAGPAALSITPAPKVSVGSCVLLGSGFVLLLTGRKALHS